MARSLEDIPTSLLLAIGAGGLWIVWQIVQSSLLAYRRHIFKKQKGCKPVLNYPHLEPFYGTDLLLQNLKFVKDGGFLEGVTKRYEKMGRYTYSSILTGTRVIQTCEPENIKAILATQFKEFNLPDPRKEGLAAIFGHGIFTTDDKEWEASRALLRPNFNRSQVGDLDTFEDHISKLIARIPRDGSTVDLQALFFMLTMDSATEFLFGHSAGSLDQGLSHERGVKFAQAFTDSTENSGNIIRLGAFGFLKKDKKFKDDVKFVHEYVQEYVQKAVNLRGAESGEKKSGASKYVFLEELAKMGYDAKKIQDELLNILLAGRDTTASLLSYVFWTLARRPDVFNKLRDEVLALGNERPTFEQIKGCKYLQWVLNEALRMFPIVPLNQRQAVVDTTLPLGGGPDGKSPIFIKAGQLINYQVYVMQRRKDLYGEDANEFKPERWETMRPGWQFLPFNGGPRICIGQQFALIEASYTTIRILQSFKSIAPRDENPFREIMTLTAAVRGGVQVSLTPA